MHYAENCNYWMTSKSKPEVWMERAAREIRSIGGTVNISAIIEDDAGKVACTILFSLGGEKYKVMWPPLPTRSDNRVNRVSNKNAALIQAATAMFHDIKARTVAEKWLGTRAAFAPFLVLPNGMTVSESTNAELQANLPSVILLGDGK